MEAVKQIMGNAPQVRHACYALSGIKDTVAQTNAARVKKQPHTYPSKRIVRLC